jgi:hypothetical protein
MTYTHWLLNRPYVILRISKLHHANVECINACLLEPYCTTWGIIVSESSTAAIVYTLHFWVT